MSTAVCVISPEEFYRHEECGQTDCKTTTLVKNIIDQHECFSKTYKYVPTKDQNYQSKMKASLNARKSLRQKFGNGIDPQQKTITSLLNKMTESNFHKLKKSVLKLCNSDQASSVRFTREMLKYAKMSDMHIQLVISIVNNTSLMQKQRNGFLEVFEEHIDEYKNHVSISFLEESFKDFDYDDYDDFCRFKKYTKECFNALKTIIEVSKETNHDVNLFGIFKQHIDNIDQWVRIQTRNRHLFVYNAFESVQYLLENTDIADHIKNDIQQVHLLCIDVLEEFRDSKKLEFKVRDIMKMCEFS